MPHLFAFCTHRPPVNSGEMARRLIAHGGCFDTHHVRWRNLLVLDDGRRTLCHLEAADAEAARVVLRQGDFALERLLIASPVRARGYPDGSDFPVNTLVEYPLAPATGDGELALLIAMLDRRVREHLLTGMDTYRTACGDCLLLAYQASEESRGELLPASLPGGEPARIHSGLPVGFCRRTDGDIPAEGPPRVTNLGKLC